MKKVAEDFKKVIQVLKEELGNEGLRLVMVFADREFAVNDVIKFLLELDFVIAAKVQMYRKYEKRLKQVDVDYAGVRYVGFLCVRHGSGAYLVILKREDGKVMGFLVRGEVDVQGAVVLAEMYRVRWGVETAFRSLEEFRIRSRTCDVGKELVLVLLSLECLVFGSFFGGGLSCGSFVNLSWRGLRYRVVQGVGQGYYHGRGFPSSPADSMLPLLFMLNKLYISSIFKKNIIY